MAENVKQGEGQQEGLSFYCDRDVRYYKQFVKGGKLDTEKLTAAGYNERQIPQIALIAEEQGWLKAAPVVHKATKKPAAEE